jgi:hypothetical protein
MPLKKSDSTLSLPVSKDKRVRKKMNSRDNLGCSSAVQCMLSIHEALRSIHTNTHTHTHERKRETLDNVNKPQVEKDHQRQTEAFLKKT